jgi:hypothetical protein
VAWDQHQALVWHYYYDTAAASGADLKQRTFQVESPHEHRGMLATELKQSCCYIANRSNVNKPVHRKGRDLRSAHGHDGKSCIGNRRHRFSGRSLSGTFG